METVFESADLFLTSITCTPNNDIVGITANGQIVLINVESKSSEVILETDITARGLCQADEEGKTFFVTNPFDAEVVEVQDGETGTVPLFTSVEGRPFIAPSAVAVSPKDNEVFFTDAGVAGASSFDNPCGAVYRTIRDRKQVVALCGQGLVLPVAVAVDKWGYVYVCEQGANQLLRYVPEGNHFVGSVFYRFNGSMGPSGVCVRDDGTQFVSLQERNRGEIHVDGKVLVISAAGELKGEVVLPQCNLLGVCLSDDQSSLFVLALDDGTGTSIVYTVPL
ncbi:hypothetical protein, conserved [Angomonas deanei]|uniref:SMP-30/Gluconolaconase/LRE-like region containing protein n=1 Tax=Angomonas deanei TaxID=59799 RepID=A0A7G2BYX6_9TRYP|nr:hypothetical protein, conserved [Angomonas deanei]